MCICNFKNFSGIIPEPPFKGEGVKREWDGKGREVGVEARDGKEGEMEGIRGGRGKGGEFQLPSYFWTIQTLRF
jgi:hypothetical protein